MEGRQMEGRQTEERWAEGKGGDGKVGNGIKVKPESELVFVIHPAEFRRYFVHDFDPFGQILFSQIIDQMSPDESRPAEDQTRGTRVRILFGRHSSTSFRDLLSFNARRDNEPS